MQYGCTLVLVSSMLAVVRVAAEMASEVGVVAERTRTTLCWLQWHQSWCDSHCVVWIHICQSRDVSVLWWVVVL